MNPGEIPALIIGGLKKTGRILKAVVRLPFFKTYLFLSLFMIVFFTLITFPYETILLKEIYRFEKKAYRSIAIGELDFNLIGESSIRNLSLVMLNGDEISINEIIFDFDMSPFNFISKKRLRGAISGTGIKYSAGKITVNCSGSSNLDLTIGTTAKDFTEGNLNVLLENIILQSDEITLPDSMMGLPFPPLVKASSAKLQGTMKNRKFLIENFLLSGPDLSGTIRGNVSLSSFMKNSRLNLKVAIKADSAILKPFEQFIKGATDDRGMIKFPLKGTLGRPKPELKLKPDLGSKP